MPEPTDLIAAIDAGESERVVALIDDGSDPGERPR